MALTIDIPAPEERQVPILEADARFKVLAAGRRFGKTWTGLIAALYGHGPIITVRLDNGAEVQRPKYGGAIFGKKIWWVAPTTKNFLDVWRDLKAATKNVWDGKDPQGYKNENEHRIELGPGLGTIDVRSAEVYENLRGPGVDGMLIDEAAYLDRRAWYTVLRPMLLDRQGWAFFYSTPHPSGKNWFYSITQNHLTSPNWYYKHGKSIENPRVTQEELDDIRSDPEMTESEYLREYEAEFITPESSKFKEEWARTYTIIDNEYILRKQNGETKVVPVSECFRFAAMDLASTTNKRSDFTVLQVWDITPDDEMILVHQDRDRFPTTEHLPLIQASQEAHEWRYIGIETVAYQQALANDAMEAGIPVEELKPPPKQRKEDRIEAFGGEMSHGNVYFPEEAEFMEVLKHEMYIWPNSPNDDQLDTAGYARWMMKHRPRKMLLSKEQLAPIFALPDPVHSTDTQGDYVIAADPVHIHNSIDPLFIGVDSPQPYWHAHIALSKSGKSAAIALGQISQWFEESYGEYKAQFPYFTVPLVIKLAEPETGGIPGDVLSNFVLILNQARAFNITSVSTSNFKSATAIQSLMRMGIAVVGPKTIAGIPTGITANYVMNEQPYQDLKLAVLRGRIKVADNRHPREELTGITEVGKPLIDDDSAAQALAGLVGFLSRYGHMTLNDEEEEFLSLEESGLTPYELTPWGS